MIEILKNNPYTNSQEYFDTLNPQAQQEFLESLFILLTQKTIIFSKFLESHAYFEDYLFNRDLQSYHLIALPNNRNIIHAVMQMQQDFLPNIIFFHTHNEKKCLGVIIAEPFNTTKEQLIVSLNERFQEDKIYYICKQDFLQEITLTLTLQQHFHKSELHQDLIDNLFALALHFHASDIHLVSYPNQSQCLLRIDGVLVHFFNFEVSLFLKLSQKLKLLCKLDINENRFPLDGHLQLKNKHIATQKYDIRISFFPTFSGESIVLRIPHSDFSFSNLQSLNLCTEVFEILTKNLLSKSGLILVSGPTGSGKSTLLYNCLRFLHDGSKKIITIEDPVEQELLGITQCQINEEIDLSFAMALKYVLRQDPDIIMIGEIRDNQTLEIALRAALTGHLVLASIHAGDCFSSLARLKDLGAKQYLLDSVIKCIIAQRLLKTLCPFCKYQKNGQFYAKGCHNCYNQGYGQRMLIQEILDFNIMKDNFASSDFMLSNRHEANTQQRYYHSSTLYQQAKELYQQGIINYEESLL